MKKLICLLLALATVLAFSACSKETPATTPDVKEPELLVSLSDDTVKPGETVSVSVKIKNIENLAAIDMKLFYESNAATAELADGSTIEGFVDQTRFEAGTITYAGFVMDMVDVIEDTLYTFDLTINDDYAGDAIDLIIKTQSVSVADSNEGNTTNDITETVKITNASITIEK
ncbi:MAG: hypothetical protein IJO14_09420 [Clostridia bacterium]|nr:hypothetical protein [Clostridia bacterium]